MAHSFNRFIKLIILINDFETEHTLQWYEYWMIDTIWVYTLTERADKNNIHAALFLYITNVTRD